MGSVLATLPISPAPERTEMPHTTVRLFDDDPLTGAKTYFVMEDGSDEFQLITQQPVDDILTEAQESRKLTTAKTRWKDMNRVAHIPGNVHAELMRKGIAFDQKELKKWLNDSDNRIFKTREGRV